MEWNLQQQFLMMSFPAALSGAHPDTPLDGPPDVKTGEGEGEQAKKRRGRKKSKLEDMFPAYLQVLTI